METISSNEIGGNIDDVLMRVVATQNPLVIDSGDKPAVVMVSLEEFNSLQETLYLLSNPANAAHLQKSINDLENGLGIPVSLDDL